MKLTDISSLRSLMEKHGVGFNKNYGQNFLINEAIPKRIADECGAKADGGILEIGPGAGTMTVELCERYKKVVAVEIDKGLIPLLEDVLCGYDNVKIINDDILNVDLKKMADEEFCGMDITVCANLPYYITTPILMYLLSSGVHFKSITVMVQKEVAARLCASAGNTEYGAITAAIAYYGDAKRLFNVSAGSFMPAPKVDSTVIKIDMYEKPKANVFDEKLLFRVIKGAFAQRRKTLVNSMSSEFSEFSKADLARIITSCGFEENIRGEKLSISDYASVCNAMYEELYKK